MTDILKRYDALLASGELKPDPEQAAAARRLRFRAPGEAGAGWWPVRVLWEQRAPAAGEGQGP